MKPILRFAIYSFLLSMIFGVAINAMEESPSFKCGNEPDLPIIDLGAHNFSGINELAFKLFPKIHNTKENHVFSPFNIQTCMGLVLAGAGESTAKVMRDCLHFGPDSELYFNSHPTLQATLLAANSDQTKFKLSSDVWVQEGVKVQQAYAQTIKKCYSATPTPLDLYGQPEISCNIINEKVSQDTDGEITNILAQVAEGTQVILTSATLFESAWASQFPDQTEEGSFTLNNGSVKNVPYMQKTDFVSYGENEHSEYILMPYVNDFAALIVLPKPGMFETVASTINQESFNFMMGTIEGRDVEIKMPKFSIRSAPNMKEILGAIGLGVLFDSDLCDLSGIISENQKLAIGEIVHQAMMDVTPAGTKAAAATVISMVGTTSIMRPTYPIAFDATRPFLLFVVNTNADNTIIFMAEVNNP
jgi:serpin B